MRDEGLLSVRGAFQNNHAFDEEVNAAGVSPGQAWFPGFFKNFHITEMTVIKCLIKALSLIITRELVALVAEGDEIRMPFFQPFSGEGVCGIRLGFKLFDPFLDDRIRAENLCKERASGSGKKLTDWSLNHRTTGGSFKEQGAKPAFGVLRWLAGSLIDDSHDALHEIVRELQAPGRDSLSEGRRISTLSWSLR